MSGRTRRFDIARSTLAFVLLHASPALCQSSAAGAEHYFQEGKRWLDARDYARACPNFAESYRLEARTGTLLALAMCHESEGKTATAWAEYREAAVRATMERRPDREQAALEWAHEVEPRLSMLTLVIPTSVSNTPALSVKLDGREVARREWGTPVALDPGEHSVSITAEGKKPWNARIVLGQVADRRTFTVHLDDVAEDQPPAAGSSALSTAQKVGIGAAIGGVVAVGIGTFFGVRAVIRNDRSDAGCDDNACDPDAKQLRLDAREDGNRATVAFITGGVLLAGGAGLFFLGKDSGDQRGHLRAAPLVGLREVGLAVGGAF